MLLTILSDFPVGKAVIAVGVLVLLLGLGVRFSGLKISHRFKPLAAFLIGGILLALGVSMEFVMTKPRLISTAHIYFEEKIIWPIQEFSEDDMKKGVRKVLDMNMNTNINNHATTWLSMIVSGKLDKNYSAALSESYKHSGDTKSDCTTVVNKKVVECQLSFKIESHVWKNLIFNDYANQAPQKKNREVNPIWVSEFSEPWAKREPDDKIFVTPKVTR